MKSRKIVFSIVFLFAFVIFSYWNLKLPSQTSKKHTGMEICILNISFRRTKQLLSKNIFSVEGSLAGIFVSKVSAGIFVIKEKLMLDIF